jgi:signal transduction histidine kinase
LELDRKNAELKFQHTKLEELINTLNITNTKLQGEIDERTIAEIKLRESEKMLKELNATKDKFFSIVAHDLKNPFNTLIGFSNLLLNTGLNLSEEKKTNYLELIYKASKRGYSLLENLLEWSRSQTGRLEIKPQEFVLKQSIKECMNLHYSSAEKKFVSLTEQIDDTTKVFADVNMFTTVMRNLISNAIKFTPENGKIDITAIEKETEVQINVSDTGLGVSKESKEKLFRIDVNHSTPGTNQEQGTGLGLILCKEFIEKNKGKIWVESVLGGGSIFSFTLPKKVF